MTDPEFQKRFLEIFMAIFSIKFVKKWEFFWDFFDFSDPKKTFGKQKILFMHLPLSVVECFDWFRNPLKVCIDTFRMSSSMKSSKNLE